MLIITESSYFTFAHTQLPSSRDEQWTGLGLDWIRTVNLFKIPEPDRIWTELMEKKCGIFVVKRLHFLNILDFIWAWTLRLKKILDYGWTWTEF